MLKKIIPYAYMIWLVITIISCKAYNLGINTLTGALILANMLAIGSLWYIGTKLDNVIKKLL